MHDELYDRAQEALNKLFSDTSVPQETAKKDLESLVDKIQTMIDSLEKSNKADTPDPNPAGDFPCEICGKAHFTWECPDG